MLVLGFVLWRRAKVFLIPIVLIGDIFTIYLWYIDLAIIWPAVHALCPVCVSLYTINYLMTGVLLTLGILATLENQGLVKFA